MHSTATGRSALDRRWFILAVPFLARLAIATQFQSLAALRPVFVERYGIDYALLGTLIGLFMLPGVVMALTGRRVSSSPARHKGGAAGEQERDCGGPISPLVENLAHVEVR